MIPESSEIKKRLTSEQTIYFVLYPQDYFQNAEEFVRLSNIFVKESLFEKVMLWFEMVISPLMTICMSWYSNTPPSFLSSLSLQKCIQTWYDWFEFRRLAAEVREWTNIVRSVGGPFISTNDAKYHVYVYADGMQRINNSLLGRGLTKESTKRV